jgi:hypothetical protein
MVERMPVGFSFFSRDFFPSVRQGNSPANVKDVIHINM